MNFIFIQIIMNEQELKFVDAINVMISNSEDFSIGDYICNGDYFNLKTLSSIKATCKYAQKYINWDIQKSIRLLIDVCDGYDNQICHAISSNIKYLDLEKILCETFVPLEHSVAILIFSLFTDKKKLLNALLKYIENYISNTDYNFDDIYPLRFLYSHRYIFDIDYDTIMKHFLHLLSITNHPKSIYRLIKDDSDIIKCIDNYTFMPNIHDLSEELHEYMENSLLESNGYCREYPKIFIFIKTIKSSTIVNMIKNNAKKIDVFKWESNRHAIIKSELSEEDQKIYTKWLNS